MSVTPGEIIVRRRSALGLSQGQLAERIGRAASTIRRWERGEATPPPAIVPALASALQVAPRDLAVAFGLEGPTEEPAAVPKLPIRRPAPATEPLIVPAAVVEAATMPAAAPVPTPAITEQPTQAVAVQTAVAAPPQQRPQRRSPLRRAPALDPAEGLSYVESNRQRMRYWLRAVLTIIVVIILVLVLFWAVGELGTALSDVWDLFGDDAPSVTAPGTNF